MKNKGAGGARAGKKPAKAAKAGKDPNKPKRPASAFFVFMYVYINFFHQIYMSAYLCMFIFTSI